MYGGFQQHVPPGGIIPGTATGVNPYPNNKQNVNLGSYLNNTPTTTSNFAAPPSFAPQAAANAPYVPHGGVAPQWNTGAPQQTVQGQYGQSGPGHPTQSGFQSNVNPSGFGGNAGYQQPAGGFLNTGAYGGQPAQQQQQQVQQASQGGGFSYPGQNSGGSPFGATYAGSVTGPQFPQQEAFNPNPNNRPGFGQYQSPPPSDAHQPPAAYGQPSGAGVGQQQNAYGQGGFNTPGFNPNNQGSGNNQTSYGGPSSQGFNPGLNQQQQPAQPGHQAWPTNYPPTNHADHAQSIAQQWAQNHQQAQTHGVDPGHNKRYSIASVTEPYHSAYATATPPPPAAPKPERPATSATFFAATAGALKTPAPGPLSPPTSHSQPQAATNVPKKPTTSASGFAGGGIGDWEHYGDFDGDDDHDDATKPNQQHEIAVEVPGDNQAVEMAAATPPPQPQTQQQFVPPSQLPAAHSSPQAQRPPTGGAAQQPVEHQMNQQAPGTWGIDRPQSGGQSGLQFQNFAPPNVLPQVQPQHPSIQHLQQPYRTSSPSQGGQLASGYNSGQAQYQQQPHQQPVSGPAQNTGPNAYNESFNAPQASQSYQLTEQLRKQQEEQVLRQQQEQQQHIQAQVQAQIQQQQQQQQQQAVAQQQGYPQNQSPNQGMHQYNQPTQSPPAQIPQQHQSPHGAAYQPPGFVQPSGVYGHNQQLPPQQSGFVPPVSNVLDPYGQQQHGQQQHGQQLHGQSGIIQPPLDNYGHNTVPLPQKPHAYQEERIQSPPINQPEQSISSHQHHQSFDGSIVLQKPLEPVIEQPQIVQHLPMQETEPVAPTTKDASTEAAAPGEGLESMEIPADLDPYYKESIRKFVRMIVREASAKSSVESLRIFTEFMEDETYSRGDRYSDASFQDYISDVSKGQTFAGRLRPFTTESPDPYDGPRKTVGSVHDLNVRRDNTFDSIDSPLTNAIEALRASGRKGNHSPSSVEHRLPYTIDEEVQPLKSQNQQPPNELRGSAQNATEPYSIPEEPIKPLVHHSDTWGSQIEPAPLAVELQVQTQPALIQPLNLKRQSIIASPPHVNPHQPPPASLDQSPDSTQPNEASLAQQAAVLAQQWRDSRAHGQQNQPNNGSAPGGFRVAPLQHRQSIPPGQFDIQGLNQGQSIYQNPPPQYDHIVEAPTVTQSPSQLRGPYQQPPPKAQSPAQVRDPYQQPRPHTQSPAQIRDPYQQPQPYRQSPAQVRDPYQQPAAHPIQSELPAPLQAKSPSQANPFQSPLAHTTSFPLNDYQDPNMQRGTPGPGQQRFNPPTSPPRNEPIKQIEIPEPQQEPQRRQDRPSISGTDTLSQGYVMVTPEPEPTPAQPIVVDISSPIHVKSLPPEQIGAPKKPKMDVAVLSTILGQNRDGIPDKSQIIVPIRAAFEKVGKDFAHMDTMRKEFEAEAKKIRHKNETERDRAKSEHDEYTEELYSQQKILYEDLHDIDEQFNIEQNALKEKQEKEEFDKFNKEVFTPVYNMVQERIVELKKQQKSLLTFIKTASSGREKLDANSSKPNLQDCLVALLDLHEVLEAHYMKLQEAIADRDKRYKSTVLTPLYASSNYAKLRDAKKYFDEEEKKAVVKAATEAHERAKSLKAVIDESMIPGLDLEFGFFDEVEQCVTKIIESLPENPAEYDGDLKNLHSELAYASGILETLTNTQASMFKLYHQVNTSVGKADKAIAMSQAKQKGDKSDAITALEAEKDSQMKTLDDELKERLEDVNGHFGEAKARLEPILAKYKAAAEGK
ncbi:hypothetical protein TWF703_011131 [Orbilia oligospora]|uniref:Uncharacterized protein n=1 Tax=Orbilia oligospora TaxID=2813651 RepID=A0A7C8JHU8_ORBOL|nr:hypothetical protein TWF703_011131 [Orbilia oligospora]